jgi:hypothetical protein
VSVVVNGRAAGGFRVGPEWAEHAVAVPATLWQPDLNDVVLAAGPGASPRVDRVRFEQARRRW